jgi:ppGpp synthetase/RelA/SpoT-type nucleotidyltranferase
VLGQALKEADLRIASITARTKTVRSFAHKLRRKHYEDPIKQITDFAGVRVVCLYRSDLPRIEGIIRQHFEVLEKVDKEHELGPTQFGYTAIHFIVQLKGHYAGMRYDELQELKCEIQTRTVLQDAWAIIHQHLAYKNEAAVPSGALRTLNGLVGLLGSGDVVFDEVKAEIEAHKASITCKAGDEFLNQEINLHTVQAYIERKYPSVADSKEKEDAATRICRCIDSKKFNTLADFEDAVRKARHALSALNQDSVIFPSQELLCSLAFIDPGMRREFAPWYDSLFRKHHHLVEK